MSEIKSDKLSPRTASGTVVLGDSGDTFSVPAGVTIANSGTATGFGKVLQVVASTIAVETRTKSTTYTTTGLSATLTPAATSSKILILVNGGTILTGAWNYDSFTALYSDIGGAGATKIADIGGNFFGSSGTFEGGSQSMNYLYSPNTTSAVVIAPYFKSSSSSYWGYFTEAGYTVSLVLMEIGA